MNRARILTLAGLVLVSTGACAPAKEDSEDNVSTTPGGTGTTPGTPSGPGGGTGTDPGNTGTGTDPGSGMTETDPGSGSQGGTAGSAAIPPEEVETPPDTEALPEGVDWTALKVGAADSTGVVHEHMYSAFDGAHTFKVPARVEGATVELSGWLAIPSDAVLFEPDPESAAGGVMITVLAAGEITIAAMTSDMLLGGAATLHVLEATDAEWIAGEARYNNGVDYMLPMLSFTDLLNPNYVPPEPPDNLACNNCHTTGAKYFEIQHTPTQIAYISDSDLVTIFTKGEKPEGVVWSLIPPNLQHLYVQFHTWEASTEEHKALIVYLRALTPVVQGEILIPNTFTM